MRPTTHTMSFLIKSWALRAQCMCAQTWTHSSWLVRTYPPPSVPALREGEYHILAQCVGRIKGIWWSLTARFSSSNFTPTDSTTHRSSTWTFINWTSNMFGRRLKALVTGQFLLAVAIVLCCPLQVELGSSLFVFIYYTKIVVLVFDCIQSGWMIG
jgi:hypothetical protein